MVLIDSEKVYEKNKLDIMWWVNSKLRTCAMEEK